MSEQAIISLYTTKRIKADLETWAKESGRSLSGHILYLIGPQLDAWRAQQPKDDTTDATQSDPTQTQ